MSDLQCPVRVYVARDGQVGDELAGVRVADVLRWTETELVDVRSAFDDLADRYRGEAVLVLLGDARGLATVEEWSGARARAGRLVLDGDADGWRIVR